MTRLRLYTALWIFGILQCITNLAFMALSEIGADSMALAVVVVLENLAGGMGTTALVALIMDFVTRSSRPLNLRFSPRYRPWVVTLLAHIGLYCRIHGMDRLFLHYALTAIPGLALLFFMRKRVRL